MADDEKNVTGLAHDKKVIRRLLYRSHFKLFISISVGFGLLVSGIGLIVGISTFIESLTIWTFGNILVSLVLPVLVLFISRYKSPHISSDQITLTSESLIVRRGRTEKTYQFKDFVKANFYFFSFIGDWLKVLNSSGEVKLINITVERKDYIVKSLYDFNPAFILPEKFPQVHRAAIQGDHTWARIHETLKDTQGNIIFLIVIPVLSYLILLKGLSFDTSLVLDAPNCFYIGFSWILIHWVLAFTLYSLREFILDVRMKNDMKVDPQWARRSLALEKKLKIILRSTYVVVSLIILVSRIFLM